MSNIKIPLFLSFYTLIFLALPGYGVFFQLVSLSFIFLQNLLTFTSLKKNKTNTFGNSLNIFSLFLIILVPLSSLTNDMFGQNLYSVQYSVLFFIVMLSIFIAIHTIDFRLILNSFICAAIAMTITILIIGKNDLFQALSITINSTAGLNRFSPLGIHPNLVGHIFGGFAVTFFCYALYGKKALFKLFFTILLGTSLLFCIAASSRGGLIASVFGIITIYTITIWQDKIRRKYFLLFIFLVFLSFFFIQNTYNITGFLSSILELNSNDRGINSGLTGRLSNWGKLLHTIFSSVKSVLIGNGLRSGAPEILGYDIDNGYLDMFYQLGLALTLCFVTLMLANTNKLRKSLLDMPNILKAVALGLFVFILFESIVARYLLSIGNPISLFLVFCILGLKNIFRSMSTKQILTHPLIYPISPQS